MRARPKWAVADSASPISDWTWRVWETQRSLFRSCSMEAYTATPLTKSRTSAEVKATCAFLRGDMNESKSNLGASQNLSSIILQAGSFLNLTVSAQDVQHIA